MKFTSCHVLITWTALLLLFACRNQCQAQYDDYDQSEDPDGTAIDDLELTHKHPNAKREKFVTFEADQQKDPTTVFAFSTNDVRMFTSNCSALFLNGTDLHALDVGQTDTTTPGKNDSHIVVPSFTALGTLADVEERIIDVAYAKSNTYNLIVVALQTHYHVYVINNDRYTAAIRSVEKIAMNGVHQRMLLFSQNNNWYCLIGNGFNNAWGTSSAMRVFKWRQTHFTLVEQYTVTLMQDLRTCQTADDGQTLIMVVGSDSANEVNANLDPLTIVEVYMFADDRMRHVQNLHTHWASLHTGFWDGRCVLIAMPDRRSSGLQRSEVYVFDYSFHVAADQQMVVFDDMVTNNYDLVVVQNQDKLTAFTTANFRGGQTATQQIPPSTQIVMLAENNKLYLAQIRRTDNNETGVVTLSVQLLAVSTAETLVVAEAVGVVGAATPSESSEQCFSDLNKMIGDRNTCIENLRATLGRKLRKDRASNIKMLTVANAFARMAAFDLIQINVTNRVSLSRLRDRIDSLRRRISKQFEMPSSAVQRLKRNATENPVQVERKLNVRHLWIRNSTFEHVLLKQAKQVRVTQPVSLGHLRTATLAVQQTLSRPKRQTSGRIQVTARFINGIEWEPFVRSLYLRNSQTRIEGNLILNQPCSLQETDINAINDIDISSIFTINTPQTVHSELFFTHLHVNQLFTNSTNNEPFDASSLVLLSGNEATINGPVVLTSCNIDRLTVAENESEEMFGGAHIVGTRQEDLSQIYSGKVTINGSLRLSNCRLEQRKGSGIFVNGQPFDISLLSGMYWMRSIDQDIMTPVRLEQPIAWSTQLFTDSLNSLPFASYLMLHQQQQQPSTGIGGAVNLVLHDAHVRGHLYTDPQYPSTVATLNANCIRRGFTSTIIPVAGRKTFTGLLVVDDFHSSAHDYGAELSALTTDVLSLQPELPLNCSKHFAQLTVLGDVHVTSTELDVGTLNGVDLSAGLQRAARITEPTTIDELQIRGNVRASNANIGLLGDIDFGQQFVQRLTNDANQRQQRSQAMHIRRNDNNAAAAAAVTTVSDIRVRAINGIAVDAYLDKLVTLRSAPRIQIAGTKRFLAGLTTSALSVRRLNDIDIERWFNEVLHTRRPQTLTGQWSIASIQAQTLRAPLLNGVSVAALMDSTLDAVELRSPAFGRDWSIGGDVLAAANNDDPFVLAPIWSTLSGGVIPPANWRQIEINGVAQWPLDDLRTPLNRLFAQAVTTTSGTTPQRITGDVTFARTAHLQNVTGQALRINDIHIPALLADALLNTTDFQAIRGAKRFLAGIAMRSLHNADDIQAPQWDYDGLNGCNILALNESLFRSDRDRRVLAGGLKTFRTAPIVRHLHVDGTVNGIATDDLVCANTTRPVPAVVLLQGMRVRQNLGIAETLNYIPLEMLLAHRVRTNTSAQTSQQQQPPQDVRGTLTIENVRLRGAASRLSSINGIPLTDFVIGTADREQTIDGRKRIGGALRLHGPAVVTRLNGIDLVESVGRSVQLDANAELPHLEVWNNVSMRQSSDERAGMTVLEAVNDVNVMQLQYWRPPDAEDLQPILGAIRRTNEYSAEATATAAVSAGTAMALGVIYLDYASDVKIKFGKSANVVADAGIHYFIDTRVECGQCALCPVQNEITTSTGHRQLHVLVARRPLFERRIRLAGRNGNFSVYTRFAVAACNPPAEPIVTSVEWSSTAEPQQAQRSAELFSGPASLDIRDVRLFEQDATSMLLFNYANGSVQIWRLDAGNAAEWLDNGLIEHNIGLVRHISVLSWQNYNVLLMLAEPGALAAGAAQMFYYDGAVFRPLPSGSIGGQFDVSAWVYVEQQQRDLMLWLAKTGGDVVTIFRTAYGKTGLLRRFELMQRIVVADGLVRDVQALALKDSKCMVVLTENSFMVLYNYNHLAGWLRTASGYFKNIEHVLALPINGRDYLYVAMRSSAVALEVQYGLI